ncbi:hypothetical protein A9Q90_05785 [Gammaproteobacteria bacterium 54_18_T64]|nr:hypothetical protein A9Q90_05785 [Gammaproteobacteria bacterium 54_18_T64]
MYLKTQETGSPLLSGGHNTILPVKTKGLNSPRLAVFFILYALVDFFSVHRNFFRRIYPETNLITFDAQYGYRYVITYYKGFSDTPC